MFSAPPPAGLFIGSYFLYYYSLCLLLAIGLSYLLLAARAKATQISQDRLTEITTLLLVAGVIGGRLGFVIQNPGYFGGQPFAIFAINSGGLSIHGMLIAGGLALYYYAKRHNLPLLKLTDLFALPVLLGQIIGRFGNYFNQELFGYPTSKPWGITIDPSHRPAGFFDATHFHPTFAYEIMLNSLLLAVLLQIEKKAKLAPGLITALYLIGYSLVRFIVEIWRISDRPFWQLSTAQLVSILIIAASMYWQRRNLKLALANNILKK